MKFEKHLMREREETKREIDEHLRALREQREIDRIRSEAERRRNIIGTSEWWEGFKEDVGSFSLRPYWNWFSSLQRRVQCVMVCFVLVGTYPWFRDIYILLFGLIKNSYD